MNTVDLEIINKTLNQRISEPLQEYYDRRIIFWKDDDGEFKDQLDQIVLSNAKLIALDDKNHFEVKKLLTVDDTVSNYLVYCPKIVSYEVDWLLPIELYSEEFRADLISIWMGEMNLKDTVELREEIKTYRKFFNNKNHRNKVSTVGHKINNHNQLDLVMLGVVCGLKDFSGNAVLEAIFRDSKCYDKIVQYNLEELFWSFVRSKYGYLSDKHELNELFMYVCFTSVTRVLPVEYLDGLNAYISSSHQGSCYDLLSDWLQSSDTDVLYENIREVETEASLMQRFYELSVDVLENVELFPCVDECILLTLMHEIQNNVIDVDKIRRIVETRRTFAWYERTKVYYEGLLQIANMQDFYLNHRNGFHTVEAYKLWKLYTEDYSKMDQYYRNFHCIFARFLKDTNTVLEDEFKKVADTVEHLYEGWYLKNLSENWTKSSKEELQKYGHIQQVFDQKNFYQEKVRSNKNNRTFVIISDALRYEVASTLADELKLAQHAKVNIDSMCAIQPTITKYGMAALLPHLKLSVNDKQAVLIDGLSTEASNRETILQKYNPNSVVLKASDLELMTRAERQNRVKGMEVVYIYHDRIDETSHTDERQVFPACNQAIDEIKNLVTRIVNDFSANNILITSDHGFLYTYHPLKEADKTSIHCDEQQIKELSRRYLITTKDAQPEYVMPVNFIGSDQYQLYSPLENIRFKVSGNTGLFVHGGTSLQEMVVPIIEYKNLRTNSKEYQNNKDKYDTKPVHIEIATLRRPITNMIFSLNFFQKEAVGENRVPTTYQMYFVDENGTQVSDIQTLICDKTNDNQAERQYKVTFNLKSMTYKNDKDYYLVIKDTSGKQLEKKERYQIDITFEADGFDWF